MHVTSTREIWYVLGESGTVFIETSGTSYTLYINIWYLPTLSIRDKKTGISYTIGHIHLKCGTYWVKAALFS